VLLGVLINLPAVMQWHLHWDYRWCAFLLQVPRELSAPFQTIGYAALIYGFWPQLSACGWSALSPAWAHGAEQLPAANADLHHAFLSLWPVYEIRPPAAAGVCYSGLGGNLAFSVLWLRYFRQGPVEWLWRQLTLRASGTSLKNTSR
jgi:uncharacterized protein